MEKRTNKKIEIKTKKIIESRKMRHYWIINKMTHKLRFSNVKRQVRLQFSALADNRFNRLNSNRVLGDNLI